VYRPNYVKASELQPLIMPLLTPAGSAGLRTSVSPIAVSPPAQVGIAADGSQAGGDTFAQNEVIVVRDYEAVLAEIDQVVAEIDKRPMQVAIEAMLLSVELSDTNSFGVDFQFLRDKQHVVMATGSPLSDLGQLSFTSGGLKLGFLDSSLGAFLSALETIGDTNVIATPRLMCLNKHKAEILIGSQLGYVTKTLTQTTTTQAVDFLQVGTQLRLRPFISTDGLIRMEVHPEISTGSVQVTDQFTIPNKQVTQVTTNIMVRDGCTVVIGGLMQESLTNTGSQVPLLGSAPGIGFLFRNRKGGQTRNEIIVLITPHIVYEPEAAIEGEKAACDFHREHAVYKDEMTPLNTRYLGRKFFRLAQKAWAGNDKKSAMRFINTAVHFDPMNRAAIDLRSDIMAGNHYGDHTATGPPPMGNPAGAMDGQTIAPWVLDHLEHGSDPPVMPVHPRDPGQPGRVITVERAGEFR
jgi:type IV pilus assembly protein PilQ